MLLTPFPITVLLPGATGVLSRQVRKAGIEHTSFTRGE